MRTASQIIISIYSIDLVDEVDAIGIRLEESF